MKRNYIQPTLEVEEMSLAMMVAESIIPIDETEPTSPEDALGKENPTEYYNVWK